MSGAQTITGLEGDITADELASVIESLDPREQIVLSLRFPPPGQRRPTLAEVSALAGWRLTRESIRRIEAAGLRRARRRAGLMRQVAMRATP